MAKWQTMYSADYINAPELEGKRWTITITRVQGAELEGENKKKCSKAVLFFKEKPKGIVLAKTNALLIASMFGDETDGWKGKRVTIHSEIVQVGQDTAPGIRVIGSPDIREPITVTVKLPRKKPRQYVMQPTGIAANGSARPTPPPAVRQPEDDPPPPDDGDMGDDGGTGGD
jgi:hypothetical protein